MSYNHQCCFDGKFIVSKYSGRWLNRRTYDLTFPSDYSQMPPSLGQQALSNSLFTNGDIVEDLKIQPSFGNDEDSFGDAAQGFGDESEDVTLVQLVSDTPNVQQKLTYQFVAEKATNLVRLAQTDQVQLGSLCNLLDQLASRIRNGHSIEVLSYDTAIPLPQENLGATPVLGTPKPTPNSINHQRWKSKNERRLAFANKRKPLLSLVGQSNDLAHVRHHVQTQRIVQYVAVQDTSEGPVLKSNNSRWHPWTWGKTCSHVMSYPAPCRKSLDTRLVIAPRETIVKYLYPFPLGCRELSSMNGST
jgi:hypothetical protein